MRFVSQLHLFILLSALCLFCGELSESVRLADDVSNDLVQLSPASTAISKGAKIAERDVISRREITVFRDSVRSLLVIPSTALAIPCAQDLLRLLSVQRK
jgi:hypothetical protein